MFVLGDFNVHSIPWLRHSARAKVLKGAPSLRRQIAGVTTKIKELTRKQYIFDIVFTDVTDCTAKTVAALADHKVSLQ